MRFVNNITNYYRSQTKFAKVMFSQVSACPIACLDTPPHDQRQTPCRSRNPPGSRQPPGNRHPLGPDTPRTRHSLGSDTPLGPDTSPEADTPPPGSRHPLEQTPPRSRHPSPSACWEIWATSLWYGSYWSAYLWQMH